MITDILALWAAAIPLMGSPGPATLSLAGIGAAYGFRAGAGYLAGIVIGTVSVLLLIATGMTGLILGVPVLVQVISVLALFYILYLAYKIATAPPLGEAQTAQEAPRFMAGYLLALANPKAYAAIGAVYASVTIGGDAWTDAGIKIPALAILIVAINSVWLSLGASISGLLRNRRTARLVNAVFAISLLASVALAIHGMVDFP